MQGILAARAAGASTITPETDRSRGTRISSDRPQRAEEGRVDQESLDRIRSATFNMARRGYDKREVDTYLSRLADWLENGAEPVETSDATKAELERIGERTAKVLSAAGEAAEEIKADAHAEVRELVDGARVEANAARVEADRFAETTRTEADDYAQAVRGKADAYAQEQREQSEAEAEKIVADAKAEADRTLEDGQSRREEIQQVIGDLEERRDTRIDELEKLAGALVGTATKHRRPEPQTEQVEAEAGEE